MCDVVGASIAHKIVKKDYIALQCKSLIVLTIIIGDRVDRNGDGIGAPQGLRSRGSGDRIAYGVPHSPAGLQSKIVNKVLDKSLKV